MVTVESKKPLIVSIRKMDLSIFLDLKSTLLLVRNILRNYLQDNKDCFFKKIKNILK